MRVVPERSKWLQIVAVFGGFFVGPYAGLRLSVALAPESEVVQTASIFGFALVFVVGTLFWMGFGLVVVIFSVSRRLARGQPPSPASLSPAQRIVPPGYRSYVILGLGAGIGMGLLAGLATNLAVPTALVAWTLTSLAYGLLLWTAAHHGFLPFSEPD